MRARYQFTTLSLSLALLTTSAVAQTHYTTGAPAQASAAVSAGAFATTVVIEGGEIFVGRPGDLAFFPIPANHAGTVHVFGLDDAGAWEEAAVLSSEAVEVGDGFGMSLAVNGNTLLVGAPMTRGGRGAVYVFTRSDADGPLAGAHDPSECDEERGRRVRCVGSHRRGVRPDRVTRSRAKHGCSQCFPVARRRLDRGGHRGELGRLGG